MASSPVETEQSNEGFIRGLGLLDSTMIVAGSMIGSGIFIVSADIARQVGSPGWLLVVWLVTGLLTIGAALSYGELAAMMPRAGGMYVYLKEAYSPFWGFLCGGFGRICPIYRHFDPADLRNKLLDRADPCRIVELRVFALDGTTRWHSDDRSADVDEHAWA
jgi:hypothetical protein